MAVFSETKQGEVRGLGGNLFAWLQALVFALLLLVLIFTFLGRIITVEGSSMVPTLHDGDMLLLQSAAYSPEPGDVVVLMKPFGTVQKPIVKRVIATGGQTVTIDYQKGMVLVDGVALDEPYIKEAMRLPTNPDEQTQSVIVPPGQIFVMGDNRNASSDSRNEQLGCVDERCILGRALVVLLPFSHARLLPGESN